MNNLYSKLDILALKDVIDILRSHNVLWWMDQGSLLGIIRDKQFLPWDHDIDIGAWRLDSRKLYLLEQAFRDRFGACYYDCLNGTIKIMLYDSSEKDYWWFDISFYDKKSERAVKYWRLARGSKLVYGFLFGMYEVLLGAPIGRSKNRLKRFIKYPFEFSLFLLSSAGVGKFFSRYLCIFIKRCISKVLTVSVDAKYFEATETIAFFGFDVNVPSSPEKYLEEKYGGTWRVPKKSWNYLIEDCAISTSSTLSD